MSHHLPIKKISIGLLGILLILGNSLLGTALNIQPTQATAPNCPGNTYYVDDDNGGSDSNNGAIGSPFLTIMHSLNLAQPGDCVLVRGGTYHEIINFNRSGQENLPITLSGYSAVDTNEPVAILDGTGVVGRIRGINLDPSANGNNYLVFQNFSVQHYDTAGFAVVGWGQTNHITLRDLQFNDVGEIIKLAANGDRVNGPDDVLIENITATNFSGSAIDIGPGYSSNLTMRNITLTGSGTGDNTNSDGIAVELADHVLVEDVRIENIGGDAVDLKAGSVVVRRVYVNGASSGLKAWGINGKTLIENNVIGNTGAFNFAALGEGPYTIRNNVFYNAGYELVHLGSYDDYATAATVPTKIEQFSNNILTYNSTGGNTNLNAYKQLLLIQKGTTITESKHNIFYQAYTPNGTPGNGIIGFQDNYPSTTWYKPSDLGVSGSWQQTFNTGETDIFTDPKFVSPSTGYAYLDNGLHLSLTVGDNYHLQSNSPAINITSGTSPTDFPPCDHEKMERPYNAASDAGAYEYGSTTPGSDCASSMPSDTSIFFRSYENDHAVIKHPNENTFQGIAYAQDGSNIDHFEAYVNGTLTAGTLDYNATTHVYTYTVPNLATGHYYIVIKAYTDGSPTKEKSLYPRERYITPQPPSTLTATATSATSFHLSWDNNSLSNTGFVIERSTLPDSGFAQIGTVSTNTYEYDDATAEPGTTYYYRVYAQSDCGSSDFSDVATGLPDGAAATPLALSYSLQARSAGDYAHDAVWVRVKEGSTLVATGTGSSNAAGIATIALYPASGQTLSDSTSYTVLVKPLGYLAASVTVASNITQHPDAGTAIAVPGTITFGSLYMGSGIGRNTIALQDFLVLRNLRAGTNPSTTTWASKVFAGRRPGLVDFLTLRNNYKNLGANNW